MNGRAEVTRLKQRLDSTFQRINNISPDLELQSDFARYLCILVSGYLEKAVVALVLEHARQNGSPSLQRFVEQHTRRFTNANSQRLLTFLGNFNPDWRRALESFLIDELKDAVDSVVNLRNTIAHGESVGITYHRVADYYEIVQRVVDRIADLCAPP
ncbi:MAG: hypothetical protein ETSY2_34435 [Candidatus Entotheonella gemina]|uniref:RiboL-PSP-HEPN domain-containing protein n=1 Tax=Candidatus Entotheonella gemina TaxID=1429439 RepID=W4LYF3_9BACT|nr:MAG: hypothetical protein ETSY2_34435 [Candidatus Entotheonella gemina]